MQTSRFSIANLCFTAILAALYAALTLLFQAISFGAVQFRVSEALTLLPVLFPQAIPGLALGCLLSNLLGSATPWDVVFGTLATLSAAILTRRLRHNVWLAALPPVLVNAVVIGLVLYLALGVPQLMYTMLTIGLGQAVVVYILGVPLIKTLQKINLPNWLR